MRSAQILMAWIVRVIVILPPIAIFNASANAATAPTCKGIDILEALKTADATNYKKLIDVAKNTSNGTALFWKIEIPKRPPSFLLGTMHLTDERVTTLKPIVAKALSRSKRIVLEIADMSKGAMNKVMFKTLNLLMFTGKDRLTPLLDNSEFSVVKRAVVAAGMPAEMTERLKPWFATMIMALSPCERARAAAGIPALDQKLADIAKKNGLELHGVETIKEQFLSMTSIPMADQVEMLKSTIKYYDRTQDLLETMIRIYQRRQMGLAWPLQLLLAQKAGADISRFESFRQNLIVKRNIRMRDRALAHLKKGGTFFAVGALHLPGKNGLVELLRNSGLKVTPAE